MPRSLTKISLVALALAALGVVVVSPAVGLGMRAAQPSSVMTVNLSAVLEKLDQRAVAAASLKGMAEELQAQHQAKQADITAMQEQAKAMGDSPEKEAMRDKLAMAALNHQAWYKFSTRKLDVEAALRYEDLYRSLKAEVARMASSNGYDLVLVDDSQGELSQGGDGASRESQILSQIAARRILYANQPTIDITDDLIQRMNNAYRSAGPKSDAR